jgi:hypothetical protein
MALFGLAMVPPLSLCIGCPDPAPEVGDDEMQVFDLAIEKRSITGADDLIRVRQGQQVELRWLADEPASIHLHGYDIRASLKPGVPVVWNFEANATGFFPIEAHGFGSAEECEITDPAGHPVMITRHGAGGDLDDRSSTRNQTQEESHRIRASEAARKSSLSRLVV